MSCARQANYEPSSTGATQAGATQHSTSRPFLWIRYQRPASDMAQAIGRDWATPLKHASFGTGYTTQWMTPLRARKRRFPCENIAVFWMGSREARAALSLSLEWSANGNLTFPRGGLWSNFRVARHPLVIPCHAIRTRRILASALQ